MTKIFAAVVLALSMAFCQPRTDGPNLAKIRREVRDYESMMSAFAWHRRYYPFRFDSLRVVKDPSDTSRMIGYSILHYFSSVRNPNIGDLIECIYYITPDYKVVVSRNAWMDRGKADSIGIVALKK